MTNTKILWKTSVTVSKTKNNFFLFWKHMKQAQKSIYKKWYQQKSEAHLRFFHFYLWCPSAPGMPGCPSSCTWTGPSETFAWVDDIVMCSRTRRNMLVTCPASLADIAGKYAGHKCMSDIPMLEYVGQKRFWRKAYCRCLLVFLPFRIYLPINSQEDAGISGNGQLLQGDSC